MFAKACAREKRTVSAAKATGGSREPSRARRWPRGGWPLVALACGGGLAFLLDPDSGRRRRQRAEAAIRHSARRLRRKGRTSTLRSLGWAKGVFHRLQRPTPAEPLDEAGLAHKVESVLFRDQRVPKGKISINAEAGTVFLRGQLESAETIDQVIETATRIPGVAEVVNLLHLPDTPAPHPGETGARSSHAAA